MPAQISASFAAAGALRSPTRPRRARLVMKDNHHDVLLLEYQPETPASDRFASGVAMSASLGLLAPDKAALFYGYSDVTRPTYSSSMHRKTQVMCTGATFPLRDTGVADWADGVPVPHVVARIANRMRLSSSCAATPVLAPAGPHNESWWGYLRRCADILGWVVRPHGTDIEFMPRRLDPTTTLMFTHNSQVLADDTGQIYTFSATQGDTKPDARRAMTASGVADDGTVISVLNNNLYPTPARNVNGPVLSGTDLPRPVNSTDDAHQELLAEVERSRLYLTASAVVAGDARLRPGVTVLLRNLDLSSDGLWYVSGAEHVIDSTAYRCHLDLLRGGTGDLSPTTTPAPAMWFRTGDSPPVAVPEPSIIDGSPLSLLGTSQLGRWVASRPQARVVVM